MITDEPSRLQEMPRTWTPAVRSSSFRNGVTLSGSTIQIDPENAPRSDTAARRRPSGDHDRNPLLRFCLSSPSPRSWTACPVRPDELQEGALRASTRFDVGDHILARRPRRRRGRRRSSVHPHGLPAGHVYRHQSGGIPDRRREDEPASVGRPADCVDDIGCGDQSRRASLGADQPDAPTSCPIGHKRDLPSVGRIHGPIVECDADL